MDLGNLFAIGVMLLGTAVWIGVPVFLWNVHRRLRSIEDILSAQAASQRLSEGRGHHPA